jgi:hypothetical protein
MTPEIPRSAAEAALSERARRSASQPDLLEQRAISGEQKMNRRRIAEENHKSF